MNGLAIPPPGILKYNGFRVLLAAKLRGGGGCNTGDVGALVWVMSPTCTHPTDPSVPCWERFPLLGIGSNWIRMRVKGGADIIFAASVALILGSILWLDFNFGTRTKEPCDRPGLWLPMELRQNVIGSE